MDGRGVRGVCGSRICVAGSPDGLLDRERLLVGPGCHHRAARMRRGRASRRRFDRRGERRVVDGCRIFARTGIDQDFNTHVLQPFNKEPTETPKCSSKMAVSNKGKPTTLL